MYSGLSNDSSNISCDKSEQYRFNALSPSEPDLLVIKLDVSLSNSTRNAPAPSPNKIHVLLSL